MIEKLTDHANNYSSLLNFHILPELKAPYPHRLTELPVTRAQVRADAPASLPLFPSLIFAAVIAPLPLSSSQVLILLSYQAVDWTHLTRITSLAGFCALG